MSLKNEIFTLVNEKAAAVICLYDQDNKNSKEVLEAINHLVDGTLEERILKSKNKELIKEGAPHFLFTNNFGKNLNIVFTKLPQTPSNSELTQFMSIINAQKDEIESEERSLIVIRPNGNSFSFKQNDFNIQNFNY